MALIDNIVSYWKLDEFSDGTGAVTREDSHSTNDLTDNNTTPSGTGIIDLGADFELSSSEFLSIADASQTGLDLTSDYTISFWYKFESLPAEDDQHVLLCKGGQGAGTPGSYGVGTLHVSGGQKSFRFWNRNTTTLDIHDFNYSILTATWYNIIARFGDSGKTYDLAVNGVDQTQQTGTLASSNGTGAFALNSVGAGGAYSDGIMDEVGIWSRRITDAEIDELYNGGAGLTYPFTGGGGSAVRIDDFMLMRN